MRRIGLAAALAAIALLAAPASAFAAGTAAVASTAAGLSVGIAGLVIAVVLLVETLQLRRVTLGGAFAEHISYVVLAVICLAASALVHWVGKLEATTPAQDVAIASEALVVTAMGLLAAYFYCVKAALRSYASTPSGAEYSRGESGRSKRAKTGA